MFEFIKLFTYDCINDFISSKLTFIVDWCSDLLEDRGHDFSASMCGEEPLETTGCLVFDSLLTVDCLLIDLLLIQ